MKRQINQRHFQIGESMKRILSRLFGEKRFEHEIKDIFSITEVSPSRGYETAIVYISALDGSKNKELVDKLNSITGEIRYELANNSEFRSTPALIFKEDSSLDYANHIEELLNSNEVKKDLDNTEE